MENRKHSFMSKFIFLCVVTTTIVTTFSFSRFQSTMSSAPGKTRVAIPILNVQLIDSSNEAALIDCNTDETSVSYEIIVSNVEDDVISEVSLKYGIEITLPSEIPDGLEVKLDGETASQNGDTYTIKNIGRFNSSDADENTHTLTFEADSDIVKSNFFENIIIKVYAEQID